jgi:flagellar basal-body rod protein FlgG
MLRLMLNSKSTLNAQQQKIDNISNNMSNIETTGYKKTSMNFEDLVYDSLKRKGYPVSKDGESKGALQNGTGIKVSEPIRNTKQGNLLPTDMKTDLAIEGSGYFEVNLRNGEKAYTRAGSFKVDLYGNLVDVNGNAINLVDDQGKDVKINNMESKLTNNNIYVNEYGEVWARGENLNQRIGKISVKDFIGNNTLTPIGGNLFVPKENATMVDAKESKIYQGFLEQSNVDVNEEMVEMIVTQRAFQLSSSALKTADEMWGMINDLRR